MVNMSVFLFQGEVCLWWGESPVISGVTGKSEKPWQSIEMTLLINLINDYCRITPRKFDVVSTEGQDADSETPCEGHSGVTVQARQTRLSLTFRKVRHTPCSCSYPKHCDSQQNWGSSPDERKIPNTSQDALRLEQTHVHKVRQQA